MALDLEMEWSRASSRLTVPVFYLFWKIEYAPLFLFQPYPFSTTLRGLGVNIIGWGRCSRYVTWDLKVDGLQK